MTTFIVTRVRKETAADRTHRHIEGVCTAGGEHYTRQHVVNSIKAGNTWKTSAGGYEATITPMTYCPHARCTATPYIKTRPDSTALDNLERLPEC